LKKKVSLLILFLLPVLLGACNLLFPEPPRKEAVMTAKQKYAVLETTKGKIKFLLYAQDAPITTANFIELADKKFYDGLTFHRYEPGFVIQGGDPKGNGTGGSDKNIKLEVTPKLKHDAGGVVAMARSNQPDSASCQFYITLTATPFLDMNYAVFGKVTEGLDAATALRAGDKMNKVYIIEE
jgi:cyclophilin family peptidyl-prolyl cis-trans isomerase